MLCQGIEAEIETVRGLAADWRAPTLEVHGITLADSGVLLLLFKQPACKEGESIDAMRGGLRSLFPTAPKKQTKV